jgi:hypothetical protein
MAHFAELDAQNVVMRVIVVDNNVLLDENGQESEAAGVSLCQSLFGGNWVQTSYNRKFRKNYAGKGFTYDPQRDAFIPPKSFKSWVLNEETCRWDPPVPYPDETKIYIWDEETVSWVQSLQKP